MYSQVFDNPFLYFIQSEVISVQNLLRVLHVVVILGINTPWQLQHRLQIIQLGGVVRRVHMHVFEPFEFFLKLCSHRFRPGFVFRTLAQFLYGLFVAVFVAKVLFDGLHLLLQEILTLPLIDLLSRTTTHIRLDNQLVQVFLENRQQSFRAFGQRMNLQQSLFGFGRHVVDRAHIIDEGGGTIDGSNSALQTCRVTVLLAEDLQNGLFDVLDGRFELLVVLERHMFFHLQSVRLENPVFLVHIQGLYTLKTLKNSHHRVSSHLRNGYNLNHSSQNTKRKQLIFSQ